MLFPYGSKLASTDAGTRTSFEEGKAFCSWVEATAQVVRAFWSSDDQRRASFPLPGPTLTPTVAQRWGASHYKPFSQGYSWIESADRTRVFLMQIRGREVRFNQEHYFNEEHYMVFEALLASGEQVGKADVCIQMDDEGGRGCLDSLRSSGAELGYKDVGKRLVQAAIEWTRCQGAPQFALFSAQDSPCFYYRLGMQADDPRADTLIRQALADNVRIHAAEASGDDDDAMVMMHMPRESMRRWEEAICADPIFYNELQPRFGSRLNRSAVLAKVTAALGGVEHQEAQESDGNDGCDEHHTGPELLPMDEET